MNVGDRVQRKGHDYCGIVIEKETSALGDRVLVQWGTKTMHEGRPGMVVADWILEANLEPWPHTVVTADEIAARTLREREREIRDGR